MGVSLSWIAVDGLPLEEVLSRLDLAATGERAGTIGTLACHPLREGAWLVIANACEHRIMAPDSMAALSAGCEALCCSVEEHVGFAACACWRDGALVWQVQYDPDDEELTWDGDPPERLHALIAGAGEDGSDDESAYFDADIPAMLAGEIGGFRYDESDPAFEATPYQMLRDLRPKRPWWRRLWR